MVLGEKHGTNYLPCTLKLKEVADIIGIGLPLVKYRIGKAKELLSVYLGDKK